MLFHIFCHFCGHIKLILQNACTQISDKNILNDNNDTENTLE